MDFDTLGYTPPATAAPSTESAKNKPEAASEEDQSIIDAIREAGGFQAYAAKIEAEKIIKMREEILESMGLSEEQLQEMPAEARAAIEDTIAREIRARMAATSAMNGDEPQTPTAAVAMSAAGADSGAKGPGFGAMLALQEAEATEPFDPDSTRQNVPSATKDEEK